jgi:toxin YoeB
MQGAKDINPRPESSMRSLVFEGNTWAAYEELRQKDKKLHKALCRSLKEMLREDPRTGTGKPEQLKLKLAGLWSRRISQKDRVVYRFDNHYIYIFAIGGHYDQFK